MRFGHKEINFIRPAAESAQAAQIACEGPSPSDTLYLKVRNGEYDCAVSMYQNQGQIALKLLGFHVGISVHSGLPFPIATPAHSTAFDIVGQKTADIEPIRHAFTTVFNMAQNRKVSTQA